MKEIQYSNIVLLYIFRALIKGEMMGGRKPPALPALWVGECTEAASGWMAGASQFARWPPHENYADIYSRPLTFHGHN